MRPTIDVQFTSVWDGGHEHVTDATLDPGTGVVVAERRDPDVEVEVLDREYVTLPSGHDLDVGMDGLLRHRVTDMDALEAALASPHP